MNRKEAIRQTEQQRTLEALGFTRGETEALRRISMTLHRWYELECGDGRGHIERDEKTGIPYYHDDLHSYLQANDPRAWRRVADREKGALRRLGHIVGLRNTRVWGASSAPAVRDIAVKPYIQTDPRGAALYILRPGDVPDGKSADSYYSRGICVY